MEAVKEGVKTGILGVRDESGKLWKEDVPLSVDTVVLPAEAALAVKQTQQEITQEGLKLEAERKKEGLVRQVTIRAKVECDRLSSVISGVIKPLREKGAVPKLTIEVVARSEDGLDRTTLNT
jgi:hypothetical protein